jgi:glucose-1-phosphate adenylyltransferase
MVIEENCLIQNCIIDKNVHIGKGVKLTNHRKLNSYNGPNIYIRDGIIVVTRGASIPDGFVL